VQYGISGRADYDLDDDGLIEIDDLAVALIGFHTARHSHYLNDHDTAMILLETASGRQACITNYRAATYGYDQRIEAVGETGMVKAENRRPHTMERWGEAATEAKAPVLHFFIERYQEAYNAEIQAFVDAVEAGGPMPVSFEDGRRALMLANAAYASLASGRAVTIG